MKCIICDKEIKKPHGFLGRCCSEECGWRYTDEEGFPEDYYWLKEIDEEIEDE